MFEIVMGIDDFLIQLVKYCNGARPKRKGSKIIKDENKPQTDQRDEKFISLFVFYY